MSDIFLCCSDENRDKAEMLGAVFEREGWTVWWDFRPSLKTFSDRARELEGAKVVVVLWSRAARQSFWARHTFEHARPGRLILVILEKAEVSSAIFFSAAFDFSNWKGESEGPVWDCSVRQLRRCVRAFIASSHSQTDPPASLDELPLSQIKENARNALVDGAEVRAGRGTRVSGVFISYRRNEAAAYARGLYDRLAARFGKERVFLDMVNVGWGEDFVEAITAAAESCSVMIALISPRWSRGGQEDVDDYVRLEVAKALGRKIRVIPILIQGAAMPAPKELPEDLAPLVRRNALALSDTRWERDVEDLMKTLEGLLKG